MRIVSTFSILALAAVCLSCASSKGPLPVVSSLELSKYLGSWYEIMRLPTSFESGLTCVKANYSLKANGDLNVVNSGHPLDNKRSVKTATGTAWMPDSKEPAKLKVRFFWPFSGDYWIIALDPNYQYAMVGAPSRKYLWILSRTRTLPEATVQTLLKQASDQGFDTTALVRTGQDCSD